MSNIANSTNHHPKEFPFCWSSKILNSNIVKIDKHVYENENEDINSNKTINCEDNSDDYDDADKHDDEKCEKDEEF